MYLGKENSGSHARLCIRVKQRQADSYSGSVQRPESLEDQAREGTTLQPTRLTVPTPKLQTREANFPNMVCSLPPGITRPTLPR